MIYGIGSDLIEVARVAILLDRHGDRFLRRCFNPQEIKPKYQNPSVHYYAKRFAAKEAFAKALGVGIGRGVNLKEIACINNAMGKPSIVLEGETLATFQHLAGRACVHITLSDERHYAQAFVLIESLVGSP